MAMGTLEGMRCACASNSLPVRGAFPVSTSSSLPFSSSQAARTPPPLSKIVGRLVNLSHPKARYRYSTVSGAWNGEIGNGEHGRGFVLRVSGRGDDNRDEEGVIKDMELYLDDLSLEYDSVWDTKPAWCQPWSIVTTGLGVVYFSWLIFHNVFVTGGASLAISFWWFSFLYLYPNAYTNMIALRRKMVKDGSEDTYGMKRVEK